MPAHQKHGVTKPHPIKEWSDRITLMQFRRGPTNAIWEARYRLSDRTWTTPRTLRTVDWTEAIFRAVSNFHEIVTATEKPTPKTQPRETFGMAADLTIDHLQQLRERAVRAGGTRKAHNYDQHIARLKRVLIPAFGRLAVRQITRKVVADFLAAFRVGVRGDATADQAPAQSTIGNIAHTFRWVMKHAASLGWIDEDAIPAMSRRGFAKPEPAAWFTRDEMRAIRDHMSDDWISAGHTELHREYRRLLRAYVALAGCSGIRPGQEMDRLTMGQVMFERSGNGRSYVRVDIKKHQGKHHLDRSVVVYGNDLFDVDAILHDLIARRAASGSRLSDLIFGRVHDGKVPILSVTFRALLEDLNLRGDPITGKERSLYALRHYYATQALLRKTDIHLLARQMGTSPLMIHTFYSKITTRMMASELSGNANEMARLRAALERIPPDPFPPTPAEEDAIIQDQIRQLQEEPAQDC
jgi:hypothetical protein